MDPDEQATETGPLPRDEVAIRSPLGHRADPVPILATGRGHVPLPAMAEDEDVGDRLARQGLRDEPAHQAPRVVGPLLTLIVEGEQVVAQAGPRDGVRRGGRGRSLRRAERRYGRRRSPIAVDRQRDGDGRRARGGRDRRRRGGPGRETEADGDLERDRHGDRPGRDAGDDRQDTLRSASDTALERGRLANVRRWIVDAPGILHPAGTRRPLLRVRDRRRQEGVGLDDRPPGGFVAVSETRGSRAAGSPRIM